MGTILAIFYLQVALILPTKFPVSWPFSSGDKGQNRFSRWPILDFQSEQFLLIFICKSSIYFLPCFASVSLLIQVECKIDFKMAAMEATLDFQSE